jgi:hypothetical protein
MYKFIRSQAKPENKYICQTEFSKVIFGFFWTYNLKVQSRPNYQLAIYVTHTVHLRTFSILTKKCTQ